MWKWSPLNTGALNLARGNSKRVSELQAIMTSLSKSPAKTGIELQPVMNSHHQKTSLLQPLRFILIYGMNLCETNIHRTVLVCNFACKWYEENLSSKCRHLFHYSNLLSVYLCNIRPQCVICLSFFMTSAFFLLIGTGFDVCYCCAAELQPLWSSAAFEL